MVFLSAWANFYVIVGSAGAALTGLQFVVVVLAADHEAITEPAARAFGTPTIVHFCVSLLISAIVSAPWERLSHVATTIAACGLGGVLYVAMVSRQARHQSDYKPVFEDWLWHFIIPVIVYAALFVAGLLLVKVPQRSLFTIGASTLLLLFTGIHNCWDSVLYIAVKRHPRKK